MIREQLMKRCRMMSCKEVDTTQLKRKEHWQDGTVKHENVLTSTASPSHVDRCFLLDRRYTKLEIDSRCHLNICLCFRWWKTPIQWLPPMASRRVAVHVLSPSSMLLNVMQGVGLEKEDRMAHLSPSSLPPSLSSASPSPSASSASASWLASPSPSSPSLSLSSLSRSPWRIVTITFDIIVGCNIGKMIID